MRRIKEYFRNSRPIIKYLIWLALIGCVTIAFTLVPQFHRFANYLISTHPTAQAAFLIFFFLYLLYSAYSLFEFNRKNETLKAERDSVKIELTNAERQVIVLQKEKQVVEKLHDELVNTEASIWDKPPPANIPFFPAASRRAKFVSLLNLKGGVGKTTLTANLAACLCKNQRELRIVVIDLDFQATLSRYCVDQKWLKSQWDNNNTSDQLLRNDLTGDKIRTLLTSVKEVDNLFVIVSNDKLEYADFRGQARFALKREDVRFKYLRFKEFSAIYNDCDYVFFDCPPRITTSSLNALTCSDYVIIPTKLDDNSISAVPRTLQWLKKNIYKISQATLLGVIANETQHYGSGLIQSQQKSYDYVARSLRNIFPGSEMFEKTVKFTDAAVHTKDGEIASLGNKKVATVFDPVAEEFLRRLKQ